MWKRIVLLFSLSQILGAFSVPSLCAFSEERKFSCFALILSSMRFHIFLLLVSTALTNPFLTNIAVNFVYFFAILLIFSILVGIFSLEPRSFLQFKASAISESGSKEHFLFVCVCRVRSGYRKQR